MNAQFLIDLAEVMANAVEELQRGDVRWSCGLKRVECGVLKADKTRSSEQ